MAVSDKLDQCNINFEREEDGSFSDKIYIVPPHLEDNLPANIKQKADWIKSEKPHISAYSITIRDTTLDIEFINGRWFVTHYVTDIEGNYYYWVNPYFNHIHDPKSIGLGLPQPQGKEEPESEEEKEGSKSAKSSNQSENKTTVTSPIDLLASGLREYVA
jgi:hypothetical protein